MSPASYATGAHTVAAVAEASVTEQPTAAAEPATPPGQEAAEALTAPAAPAGSKALGWPCLCGNQVGFDQDECPACGSPFLGDLRGENDGRHRVKGEFSARWNESRVFRFVVAGGVAFLVAVVIPVLLALLG